MRLSKALMVATVVTGLVLNGSYSEAKPVKKVAKVTKNVTTKPVVSAPIPYYAISQQIEFEQYATASNQLYSILKRNPSDINARSLLIISEAKQSKFDVAQSQLNEYLTKYPKNANLHYAQGIVNVKRQASSDMDYRENSEELLKSAINEFNSAIKINPKHYQSYNALGVIALNVGNFDKARGFFNKAIDINPNYATAIDNAGSIDYLQNDLDEAQTKFLKAISINPNSSTAYFHLAQVYNRKSMYSKGLDALDHSLRLQPNSSVSYNLRGEILKKQGNEAAALEAFKKAIAVKPENTRPYMNMATIYEKRYDNELAISHLKSALAVNPQLNSAKLHIGDLALLKGDYKEALKYYSQLVGVKDYNAEALKGMANAYFEEAKETASKGDTIRNREFQTAYSDIQKALEANPNDLQLYLAKLKLAKITNQEKESYDILKKIIDTPIRGLNDVLAKGDAYYAMNKYQDAKLMFDKSVVFAQSLDDYLYISEILTYDKFYPSAKDILRYVLIQDPTNAEALQNLNYIMTMERQSDSLYKDAKFFQRKDKNRVFAREYALKSLNFNPTSYKSALLSAKLCEKQKHYEEAIDAYEIVAGLEANPRKVKRVNKKINKLEKKLFKVNRKYMKKENKEFKRCQNKLTPNL